MDYTALLALVAVAFAGAGAAAGLGAGIPKQVEHAVRTAICIVGGDVCRHVDARADGLAPCVVAEQAKGGGLTLSVFSLRLGEQGEWSVARRSDGTVLVTRNHGGRVGVGGGLGFELGSLELGVSASADAVVRTGSAWELPSVAAAARFLTAVRDGSPLDEPTWRFGSLGDEAKVRAGLDGSGVGLAGVEAQWGGDAGVRIGRGETTVYLDAGVALDDPIGLLPSDPARGTADAPGGGPTGPLLFALTWDGHGQRELAFRRVQQGARSGEVVETVGRLDLREPGNRAVADRLLHLRPPWSVRDLRSVLLRTVQAGTVERSVYAVQDRSHEFDAAARLEVELGVEVSRVELAHHLVAASAWTHGSPERRRVDCVGEAA